MLLGDFVENYLNSTQQISNLLYNPKQCSYGSVVKLNRILYTVGALLFCIENVAALEDNSRKLEENTSHSERHSIKKKEHLIQSHYDPKTHSLNLSNQNLYLIPEGVRDLEDLEVLDLSNNELTCLSNINFCKQLTLESCIPKNLKKLDISGNGFLSLEENALPSNLEELTLDGYLVKFIPKKRVISVRWDTPIEVVKNLLLAYRNRYPIDNLSFLQILSPVIATVIFKGDKTEDRE